MIDFFKKTILLFMFVCVFFANFAFSAEEYAIAFYAITELGQVKKSLDEAATWKNIPLPDKKVPVTMAATEENELYIWYADRKTAMTPDSGVSWIKNPTNSLADIPPEIPYTITDDTVIWRDNKRIVLGFTPKCFLICRQDKMYLPFDELTDAIDIDVTIPNPPKPPPQIPTNKPPVKPPTPPKPSPTKPEPPVVTNTVPANTNTNWQDIDLTDDNLNMSITNIANHPISVDPLPLPNPPKPPVSTNEPVKPIPQPVPEPKPDVPVIVVPSQDDPGQHETPDQGSQEQTQPSQQEEQQQQPTVPIQSLGGIKAVTHEDTNKWDGVSLDTIHFKLNMHSAEWINWHFLSLSNYFNSLYHKISIDLANHVSDKNNPHNVTAGQVGAYTKTETDQAIEDAISHIQPEPGPGGSDLTVSGASGPAAEYVDHTKVTAIRFNKESGFNVEDIIDKGKKYLQISLGSSWTELIPDFPAEGKDTLRPSGEEKLSIKAVPAEHTGTYWDYSNTNKDEKTFVIGINTAGETAEDITVSAPIGQYTNNAYIPAGTSMSEVFRKMLVKRKNPVQPTFIVNLKGVTTESGKVEYGYQFPYDSYLEPVFTKNDAGNVIEFTWSIGDYSYSGSTVPSRINEITSKFSPILENTFTAFSANFAVQYTRGDIVDPDYPDDRIPAGTKTYQITITPSRYIYYESMNRYIDNENFNPTAVKGLRNKYLSNRGKNSQLSIPCNLGDVQISIAVPMELVMSISSFKFRSQSGSMILESDITDQMKIVEVSNVTPESGNLGDISAANANKYRIYSYQSLSPFESTVHIIVNF